MLSVKNAKFVLKLVVPVFIAVLSIFVFGNWFSDAKFVTGTIDSLDESKTTVIEFSGATMASSLAISALPDDFASPLASTLSDMNKYFILILMVLFVERLVMVEGVKIAFVYIIPIACMCYFVGTLIKKDVLNRFAYKFAILGLALVTVIPVSTHFTNSICAEYKAYVNETISEAKAGAEKINEVVKSGDEEATIFEKLTDVFKTAVNSVNDLMDYLKNSIKKCVNSIAILLVTTCVMPLLTLWFFKWLLAELFRIKLPEIKIHKTVAKPGKAVEDEEKV